MVTRAASLVLRAAAVASALALVVGVSSAGAAFVIGPQVNDDPAAGIDPNQPLSSENPDSDLVGGALTAGKVNVPWSIFRQTTTGKDQIFVAVVPAAAWRPPGASAPWAADRALPRSAHR